MFNISVFQPEDNIETRIIGGSEVNPSDNRYPYFVSMRGTGVCGAVLITPSIAITAAHVSDGMVHQGVKYSKESPPTDAILWFSLSL